MPAIPTFLLKKLYVKGSLHAEDDGFALDLKNSIAPASITALTVLDVDGEEIGPTQVVLIPPSGNPRPTAEISSEAPLLFPVGATITLRVSGKSLEPGTHEIVIHVVVREIGLLGIPVSDTLE
jgi:hypothetical protein